jgi:hypothetical protein
MSGGQGRSATVWMIFRDVDGRREWYTAGDWPHKPGAWSWDRDAAQRYHTSGAGWSICAWVQAETSGATINCTATSDRTISAEKEGK